MCGILAVYKKNVSSKEVITALNLMLHRGPDDSGIVLIDPESGFLKNFSLEDSVKEVREFLPRFSETFIRNKLILGHRRLSILDLSYKGHQPMITEDERYSIVYNGEIYNYIELREELKKSGYRFTTGTDTEVLLYGFYHWKESLFQRLNGMWALVIYDKQENQLIVSRDRYKIKPLYYYLEDSEFIFSSEIKPILFLTKNKELNRNQILYYLAFGKYLPDVSTVFKNIYEFPSAQYAVINLNDPEMKLKSYYSLEINPDYGRFKEKEFVKYKNEIKELLYDSVRLRLRSDVPVGTCLSGGLDSSIITIVINELLTENRELQNTFTASFPEFELDEKTYAAEIIKKTGANGHFIEVREEDLMDGLSEFIFHQELPMGSFSPFAQFMVMKLVNQHRVKVTLDGQGADELFAGYQSMYYPHYLKELIQKGRWLELFYFFRHNGSFLKYLSQMLFIWFYPEHQKNSLIIKRSNLQNFMDLKNLPEYLQYWGNRTLNETLKTDLWDNSLPILLRYEDYNSMAFSIEARLPFLDYRLVDYLFQLPAVYKIHNGQTKYILKKSFELELPEMIKNRKDKIGFAVPQVKWIQRHASSFKELIRESNIAKEFVDINQVMSHYDLLIEKAARPSTDAILFRLINLSMWEKVYFKDSFTRYNFKEMLD
jgi:asparagine synthase (glutamine-hydrolysing)